MTIVLKHYKLETVKDCLLQAITKAIDGEFGCEGLSLQAVATTIGGKSQ